MRKKALILITILCIGLLPRITLAETYDGEYSLEYLLRNYGIVTLGQKDLKIETNNPTIGNINKGDVTFNKYEQESIPKTDTVEGAVLINGNISSNKNVILGSDAGTVKSFIKGTKENNITVSSDLVTDQNYIDFGKMYQNVMNDSMALIDNTEYHINKPKLEVSKPGIYTIHNIANSVYYADYRVKPNTILIKNYNKNDIYVFNYYNQIIGIDSLPNMEIMEEGSPSTVSLFEYIESGNYTGNIIFNFPYATVINIGRNYDKYYGNFGYTEESVFIGNIVAPKAIVMVGGNGYHGDSNNGYSYYYSSIIANAITVLPYWGDFTYNMNDFKFKKSNYKSSKKIIKENNDTKYIKETKDYADDYYDRDYSISDLLTNYSLITLGKKQIDSKCKLLEFGNTPGSIKLFHITGQALISGDVYGKVYENEPDSYYGNLPKYDRTAFDLESNEVTESYIRGNIINNNWRVITVIQPWDNMVNDNKRYEYQKNNLMVGGALGNGGGPGNFTGFITNYINFDRLYSNIISEQSKIEEGTSITPSKGKAHIRVGGSYVIDDINDIDEIIFDNFDDNKKYITVITIKNSGDINFPLISKDTGSYKGIVTNDYFGKEQATHLYEQDTFTEDTYFGNIVWNIPNATYIKLKEGAPFAGHLIAPNADVETPETHFAGCFIVNSIYGEGNTEAHFYPLTSTTTYDIPKYDQLTSSEAQRLNNLRLKRLLGGKGSQIETTVIGNEEEFRREEAKLNDILDKEEKNKNNVIPPIIDILQNPLTKRNIIIILSALIIISVTIYLTFKKKIKR